MPQLKKHASPALRQAAYRARQAAAQREQLRSRGLPALPVPAQIPGHARWRSAIQAASQLVEQTAMEMRRYHDDRSETWQETARAETLNRSRPWRACWKNFASSNEEPDRVKIHDEERRGA